MLRDFGGKLSFGERLIRLIAIQPDRTEQEQKGNRIWGGYWGGSPNEQRILAAMCLKKLVGPPGLEPGTRPL